MPYKLIAFNNDRLDVGEVSFLELNDAIFADDTRNCDGLFRSIVCTLQTRVGYSRFTTPGGIITTAMPYLFGFAGIILFVMIVWGGLEVMMGAASPKSAESGQKRITAAIIGFLLLFSAFWIAQIVQLIFGINIGIGLGAGN